MPPSFQTVLSSPSLWTELVPRSPSSLASVQRTDTPERQCSVKDRDLKSQTQRGEEEVVTTQIIIPPPRLDVRMRRIVKIPMGDRGKERTHHTSSNHSFLNSAVMWSHRLGVVARHAGVACNGRKGWGLSILNQSIRLAVERVQT